MRVINRYNSLQHGDETILFSKIFGVKDVKNLSSQFEIQKEIYIFRLKAA